jgi:pyruvate,orthophosphate dikinase
VIGVRVADQVTLLRLDGAVVPSREDMGGKAHSLAAMAAAGLPVPPAFALGTAVCRDVSASGLAVIDAMWDEIRDCVGWLESVTRRSFGGTDRPLLVSVRSGAARSMPGMMDTILDLGMTPDVEAALATECGAEFAADTAGRFRELFTRITGSPSPDDPWHQLRAAILAVFASWNSMRAQAYRREHGIDDSGGTAVTVQAMVFGNLDETSGTGVLFSRNPLTGDAAPYGEWLPGGQGEDVVSGKFDPLPLASLAASLPTVHDQLMQIASDWERSQRDVQDIEFTVESGRLWILQSRAAKRSPQAGVRLAVGLAGEGLISPAEAVERVSAEQLKLVLRPGLSPEDRAAADLVATGEPACPGVASGVAVTDPDEAEERAEAGEDVVLVRSETSPDDVHGMIAAVAVVTGTGGSTSHAAVVCRELGRPCVVGCGDEVVEALRGTEVTVDGDNGEIRAGRLTPQQWNANDNADLKQLAAWAAEHAPERADLLALLG